MPYPILPILPSLDSVLPRAGGMLLCAVLAASPPAGAVEPERDPRTGLLSWQVTERGLAIELIQLLPDYVRALYESRGLPERLIEGIASYCVFGTIVRNVGDEPLSYRVADWRYVAPDGEPRPLKTKDEWVREWRRMGVDYMWSILPAEQTFAPGDWGQGFTTVPLAPESRFDLIYTWSRDGKTFSNRIEGLRCAPREPPAR